MLPLTIDSKPNDAHRTKVQRSMVGALYGFLGGTAFVFIAAFVDLWLYPDLPLGVGWSSLAMRWSLVGFGLALIGAVTAWWNETWAGLVSGAITAGLIGLLAALLTSRVGAGLKLLVLAFTLMPIAVLSLPVAWTLRWFVERHGHALHSKSPVARIAILILAMVVLGAGIGYFGKMSPRAVTAMRFVHRMLQEAPDDEKNPMHQLPGLKEHAHVGYKLFQEASGFSTEGYDVRAEYEDGYVVQCVTILYPGRDPYLSACKANP